jgi:hypothetical protein
MAGGFQPLFDPPCLIIKKSKDRQQNNMRQWNVKPELMCNQHLLGEHVEMHMFVGTLNKGKSIKGYIDTGLVEVHNLRKRHDEIAKEMEKRGFSHNSLLPDFECKIIGKVNRKENLGELRKRCKKCRKLQKVGRKY